MNALDCWLVCARRQRRDPPFFFPFFFPTRFFLFPTFPALPIRRLSESRADLISKDYLSGMRRHGDDDRFHHRDSIDTDVCTDHIWKNSSN